jgi:cytochrome c oxidase subunit II
VFNTEVKLVGGATVKADEQYIRNSILNPTSQVVEGFQPIMPTFKGQVTEEQLNALVAYIKSLTPGAATATSTSAPSSGANTAATGPANSMAPRKADRGKNAAPGSNPNTPNNSNR